MADDQKLNLRKVIADNAHVSDLANLASSGVRRVKVLDEDALQEMIQRAIDQVVNTQTAEERTRILADSRKQLTKLMNERDEFTSRASMLEAGHNELIAEIEKLQNELKLRRTVEEGEAELKQASAREKELTDENAWVREEHGRMVEELDREQTQNKRLLEEAERARGEIAMRQDENEALKAEVEQLKEEIERLKAEIERLRSGATTGQDELRKQLEDSEAEVGRLFEQLAQEEERARKSASLQEELDAVRKAGETAAAALRHQLERAREEAARLEKEALETRHAQENQAIQHAEVERELREELERHKAAPAAEVIEEVPIIEEPIPPAPQYKPGKGLDVGTVNLVAAAETEKADTELRPQRNVFLDVETTPYTKAMLTNLNVGYVIQGKRMYILGEPAFELANVLNRRTRRPMKDGLISPKEQDALPIMKLLIGSHPGRAPHPAARSASTRCPATRRQRPLGGLPPRPLRRGA